MKLAVAALSVACLVLLGTFVSSLAQPAGASPPPGVLADAWVPISESAGIVLVGEPDLNAFNRFNGRPDIPGERSAGILMAQHNGQWITFGTLGDTSAQIVPLH